MRLGVDENKYTRRNQAEDRVNGDDDEEEATCQH